MAPAIKRSMVVSTPTADQTIVKARSTHKTLIGGRGLSNLYMGARMPRVRPPLLIRSLATTAGRDRGRTAIRRPPAVVIQMAQTTTAVIVADPVTLKMIAHDHERAAARLTGNPKGRIRSHTIGIHRRLQHRRQ